MELIKEIQLDSKEVEEAITDYLKKEGTKPYHSNSNHQIL